MAQSWLLSVSGLDPWGLGSFCVLAGVLGVWGKGSGLCRGLRRWPMHGLRAGDLEFWEEALPIPADPPPPSICARTLGGAAAPGRTLQIQQAEPLLQLSHQPLVASLQTALTLGLLKLSAWVPGPRLQCFHTTAWAAICPIKSIPDAILLCPESLQMGASG